MKIKDKFEEKILEEIRSIPFDDRSKIFEIIHYMRLGIIKEKNKPIKQKNKYAGIWKDLKPEEVELLLSSYKNRDSYFQERQIY